MIDFLKKYKTLIMLIIGGVLTGLFLDQCNQSQKLEKKTKKLKKEIKQNKAALKDSGALIKSKKNKIYLYSKKLQRTYNKIDSLKEVTPEKIVRTEIQYIDTSTTTTPNQVINNKNKIITKFNFNDNIMGFKGKSFLKIQNKNDSFNIKSDSVKIYDKKINFGIATYQFRKNDIIKVGAKPYAIKKSGKFGKELKNINLKTKSASIDSRTINNNKNKTKYVPTISIGAGPMYPVIGNKSNVAIGLGVFIGYGRRLDN